MGDGVWGTCVTPSCQRTPAPLMHYPWLLFFHCCGWRTGETRVIFTRRVSLPGRAGPACTGTLAHLGMPHLSPCPATLVQNTCWLFPISSPKSSTRVLPPPHCSPSNHWVPSKSHKEPQAHRASPTPLKMVNLQHREPRNHLCPIHLELPGPQGYFSAGLSTEPHTRGKRANRLQSRGRGWLQYPS